MYSELDKNKYIDVVGRIFSIACDYKINMYAITDTLQNSDFIFDIENNNYSVIYNNSVREIFAHIFNLNYLPDNSFMNYNAAYWCGYVYMNLFYKYRKPFSYIFLVLPLHKLISLYDVYHEMDMSAIYELFIEECNSNTILRRLLKYRGISLKKLSCKSCISYNTLMKYYRDDETLYNGSFKNVHSIAVVTSVPDNLFIKELNHGTLY